jgi:hypothetical protein
MHSLTSKLSWQSQAIILGDSHIVMYKLGNEEPLAVEGRAQTPMRRASLHLRTDEAP